MKNKVNSVIIILFLMIIVLLIISFAFIFFIISQKDSSEKGINKELQPTTCDYIDIDSLLDSKMILSMNDMTNNSLDMINNSKTMINYNDDKKIYYDNDFSLVVNSSNYKTIVENGNKKTKFPMTIYKNKIYYVKGKYIKKYNLTDNYTEENIEIPNLLTYSIISCKDYLFIGTDKGILRYSLLENSFKFISTDVFEGLDCYNYFNNGFIYIKDKNLVYLSFDGETKRLYTIKPNVKYWGELLKINSSNEIVIDLYDMKTSGTGGKLVPTTIDSIYLTIDRNGNIKEMNK